MIPHFAGSYSAALNASGCAPGHVVSVWDNGLASYGMNPSFLLVPGMVAVEPGSGPSRATGTAVEISAALQTRIRELRSAGSCGAATCRDSEGNAYDVTFLASREVGTKRFTCLAAGLPGKAAVAASAVRVPASACQVGVRLRPARGK